MGGPSSFRSLTRSRRLPRAREGKRGLIWARYSLCILFFTLLFLAAHTLTIRPIPFPHTFFLRSSLLNLSDDWSDLWPSRINI